VCLLLGASVSHEQPETWLQVLAIPSTAVVHRTGDRADTVLELDLANRTAFRVRVERVVVAFLSGDRQIESVDLGKEFFKDPVFSRSARIDGGQRIAWDAICLDSVPPDADRLRFDLELSGSRKLGPLQATQSIEVALDPGPEPVVLRLPFEGYWLVSQGHTCSNNHRTAKFGHEFAWDFAAVGPGGTPGPAYRKSRLNVDAYGFGQPILAPAAGRVVRVVADVTDNDGLESYPRRSLLETLGRPEWIFGNFVVLDVGDGAFVLLGHLRRGSVAVAPGQLVQAGDRIGECGNSGNSQSPHLHMQIMNRPDPAHTEVQGLPGLLANYLEFSAGSEGRQGRVPAKKIEVGDPPEGSVIAPTASGSRSRPRSGRSGDSGPSHAQAPASLP